MSGAFTIGGVLIGVMASKINSAEPAWAWLLVPAGIALWVGWYLEHMRS